MDKIEQIKVVFADELATCTTLAAVQELKVKYLGKTGELTGLLKSIKDLPAEERPSFGAKVNELRNQMETVFAKKLDELKAAEMQRRLQEEKIDVSLTASKPWDASWLPRKASGQQSKSIIGISSVFVATISSQKARRMPV